MSLVILFTLLPNAGVSVPVNEQTNQTFPNNTNLINSSNITRQDSNFTNHSQITNTTIPDQLSPESVNGSKTGKI